MGTREDTAWGQLGSGGASRVAVKKEFHGAGGRELPGAAEATWDKDWELTGGFSAVIGGDLEVFLSYCSE